MSKIKVTVWNEFEHEKHSEEVKKIYPDGIHNAIAKSLCTDNFEVRTATLDQPEHGLTDDVLNNTDVLVWWGHMAHHKVADEVAAKVVNRVLRGMGFIALHSAHASKIFTKLMGTSGNLTWRESGDRERVWTIEPGHPIAKGLDSYFELPAEETYGERFDIPAPNSLVFVSWFSGGEVFRSGCCYLRGLGKVFYFRPGHESFPTFHNENVIKIINNAALWAAPNKIIDKLEAPMVEAPEKKYAKNQ